MVKSTSCSEGNLTSLGGDRPDLPPQHWGLSTGLSQDAASFDQEGSEVFGLLNLYRDWNSLFLVASSARTKQSENM